LHPQLSSCDHFAVVLSFDFDEPNLLRPASQDWRAGGPHSSVSMWTEEVGGVRHADDGHTACHLVSGDRCSMTANGFNDGGPNAAVNDSVGLLVPFIDINISNDSRRRQLLDAQS
jgi:hypothetical protein